MRTINENGVSRPYRHHGQSANNFDYAAVSHHAAESSDEFVDCFPLSVGEVTLAIGDWDYSDLRYSALVSCIRKYLRSRLVGGPPKPVSIALEMNEMVYECCGNNCFLSCFFATYRDGMLSYVNAGHGSPLLLRGESNEIVHLDKGGPVFGLQHSPLYVEGIVLLQPGDRVVAFSPSVMDSFCGKGRLSPETSLVSLVKQNKNSSAAGLAEVILTEAENAEPGMLIDRSVVSACVNRTDLEPSVAVAQDSVAVLVK
jgi:sigma-B regulation protein RsbU (phosphoserine phosphatase)